MSNNGKSFFAELKRRNVYRVGIAYVIVGWLALQALDIVVPIMRAPEWFSQLVLVLLVIGLPFALIFAWAYEMTPEGLKREKDVDRAESITQETGEHINKVTTAVLVFAVGFLLIDKFLLDDAVQEPAIETAAEITDEVATPAAVVDTTPSIAVLPFANMSADESSAYFSDGLADTLLHMLAQIREIRVAARTSSFQFRDQNTDIKEIANALNVGTILEGSVQRAGNKVRVTAQLIEADTGYHLWSGNYDRDMDDIFGIQDEIASEVVAALKVSLLGESAERFTQHDTENLDAYNAFLKAQSEIAENTYESLQFAEANLIEAIRLDPNYALAYSRLAQTYTAQAQTGVIGAREMNEKGRPAAEEALRIDPDLSEALALLGYFEHQDNNKDKAEELLLRAITTGANDIVAMSVYADYLQDELRLSEAVQITRAIADLDPLSVHAARGLQLALMMDQQFDEAMVVGQRIDALEPGSNTFLAGIIQYMMEDWALGAIKMASASLDDPNDPEGPFLAGVMFLNLELADAAEEQFRAAVQIDPSHPVSLVAPLLMDLYRGDVSHNSYLIAKQMIENKVPSRQGSSGFVYRVLTDYAITNQSTDDVIDIFRNQFPAIFDEEIVLQGHEISAAFFAGRLLLHDGQTVIGTRMIEATRSSGQKFTDAFGVSPTTIAMAALLGDDAGAINMLESLKFNFSGFRQPWVISLRNNPDFDGIKDHPVFIARLDELSNKAAQQRAILEEMSRE